MNRSILIPMLGVALCISAAAQRMGSVSRFPARHSAFHSGFNHSRNFPLAYPLPFFDPVYSDYFPDTRPAEMPQPSVVVVQAPAPSRAAENAASPSQPLMIELRGNAYVQVSGDPQSQLKAVDLSSAPGHLLKTGEVVPNANAQPSPSALLVFRDGHREEVSGYTITAGMLYANANYYTAGSWNRTIPISSLNVSETIDSNRSRGVQFHLPGAPNEVIVGP